MSTYLSRRRPARCRLGDGRAAPARSSVLAWRRVCQLEPVACATLAVHAPAGRLLFYEVEAVTPLWLGGITRNRGEAAASVGDLDAHRTLLQQARAEQDAARR